MRYSKPIRDSSGRESSESNLLATCLDKSLATSFKGMIETKYKVEILKKLSLELQIEKPEVEPNGILAFIT